MIFPQAIFASSTSTLAPTFLLSKSGEFPFAPLSRQPSVSEVFQKLLTPKQQNPVRKFLSGRALKKDVFLDVHQRRHTIRVAVIANHLINALPARWWRDYIEKYFPENVLKKFEENKMIKRSPSGKMIITNDLKNLVRKSLFLAAIFHDAGKAEASMRKKLDISQSMTESPYVDLAVRKKHVQYGVEIFLSLVEGTRIFSPEEIEIISLGIKYHHRLRSDYRNVPKNNRIRRKNERTIKENLSKIKRYTGTSLEDVLPTEDLKQLRDYLDPDEKPEKGDYPFWKINPLINKINQTILGVNAGNKTGFETLTPLKMLEDEGYTDEIDPEKTVSYWHLPHLVYLLTLADCFEAATDAGRTNKDVWFPSRFVGSLKGSNNKKFQKPLHPVCQYMVKNLLNMRKKEFDTHVQSLTALERESENRTLTQKESRKLKNLRKKDYEAIEIIRMEMEELITECNLARDIPTTHPLQIHFSSGRSQKSCDVSA